MAAEQRTPLVRIGGIVEQSSGHAESQETNGRIVGVAAEPLVTLAVAMESLRGIFGHASIDDKVQEALDWAQWFCEEEYYEEDGKRKKRNPHKLSLDGIASIVMYTLEWATLSLYAELNRRLRSEQNALQPFFPYLKLFLTALYRLPTRKMMLYRGMRMRSLYSPGEVTTFWGFSSATPTLRVLNNPQFLGQSGDRIALHISGRCTDISHYSMFGSAENERLVEPARFEVTGVVPAGNDLTIVQLEQVDDRSCFDFAPPRHRKRLEEEEKQVLRKWICGLAWVLVAWTTVCMIIGHEIFVKKPGKDWVHKHNLSEGVSKSGAVVSGEFVWLIGGYTFNERDQRNYPSDVVQRYDPGQQKWQAEANRLVEPLAGHAVVIWRRTDLHMDLQVVTGGKDRFANKTRSVQWRSLPSHLRWSPWKPMKHSRAGHCSMVYSVKKGVEHLYVMGGDDHDGRSVEYFDGYIWQEAASMIYSHQNSFATALLDSKLFVFGGATLSVEYFDGTLWRATDPMEVTSHREGINAVEYAGKVYILGSSMIEVGTWANGRLTWKRKWQQSSLWLPGQLYMAGCVYGKQYWALGGGGTRNTRPSNQVWAFNLKTLPIVLGVQPNFLAVRHGK